MEPVDKVRARADALADLGLSPCAGSQEIRDAWRQIAFHSHPDHKDGDSSGFSRAKAAGISLTPGSLFGSGAQYKHCIRLNFSLFDNSEKQRQAIAYIAHLITHPE